MNIQEQKSFIRLEMKKRLLNFAKDKNLYEKESQRICNFFINSTVYKDAEAIFAFLHLSSEINVDYVIEKAFQDGKKVCIPKCNTENNMDFFSLDSKLPLEKQIVMGKFGIREPITENIMFPNNKTAIIVPGLAFSKKLQRFGRGKGFYDRYIEKILEFAKPMLSGFCFDFQVFDDIPEDLYDKKVDFLFANIENL